VLSGNLSVRQVEEMVREEKDESPTGTTKRSTYFDFSEFIAHKNTLAKKLNADIRYKSKSNDKGSIIIHFSSKDHLKEILAQLD